jgi:osmotically-inducible protein OsmY
MNSQPGLFRVLVLGATVLATTCVLAQEPQSPPPDNTKVNQRDRDGSQSTADQQKENANDKTLARQIRQALVKDKTLSTYAHNVKVISQGGQVTLKGPVRSQEEKRAVESKAEQIAGEQNVTSQLEVAPPKQ